MLKQRLTVTFAVTPQREELSSPQFFEVVRYVKETMIKVRRAQVIQKMQVGSLVDLVRMSALIQANNQLRAE